MAQCKYCGRSGWLLSVDSAGLCAQCRPAYQLTLSERSRVIDESREIIVTSTKIDTRLSRCDVVIDHAKALLDYQRRGVPTVDPPPSELIQSMTALKDRLIVDGMRDVVVEAQRKADVAQTVKTKAGALRKGLLSVREYGAKASTPGVVRPFEQDLQRRVARTELAGYLDEAQKAEFKGNKKKALDQYYEALYFLNHEYASDLQGQRSNIEAKITALGGKLPTAGSAELPPPADQRSQS